MKSTKCRQEIRISISQFVAFILLSSMFLSPSGFTFADTLKSGPQPGTRLRVFSVLVVTGPRFAGKKISVTQAYYSAPFVAIFARKPTKSLQLLVKKLDSLAAKKSSNPWGGFVVFMNDDPKLTVRLKAIAKEQALKRFMLCAMPQWPNGPPTYKIAKEADITVLLCRARTAKVNHSFRKGELNAKRIERILADLPKILKK